jgi:hypothetical protein
MMNFPYEIKNLIGKKSLARYANDAGIEKNKEH